MAQMNPNLTADEFERAVEKDSIQLLDVRTPGEYTAGHIKNTLLADWNDEKEFYRRIAFIDKQIPVYVYCLGVVEALPPRQKCERWVTNRFLN
jgi:rhodanese-related sulfurtransferase